MPAISQALQQMRGRPIDYDSQGLEQPAIDPIMLISSLLGPGLMRGAAGMMSSAPQMLGSESGALFPEQLAKINSTDYYHGSGTSGLTKEAIDPLVTNHESIFGQGLYMTDNPQIAESYAAKRGGPVSQALYKARLNAQKGFDLEAPLEEDFKGAVFDQAKDIAKRWGDPSQDLARLQRGIDGGYIKTNQDLYQAFRNYVGDVSAEGEIPTSEFSEDFQNLNDRFRKMGYQVMRHTGGLRAGKGKTLHEVAVLLDPSAISDFARVK